MKSRSATVLKASPQQLNSARPGFQTSGAIKFLRLVSDTAALRKSCGIEQHALTSAATAGRADEETGENLRASESLWHPL
jgi:hypothetical protein